MEALFRRSDLAHPEPCVGLNEERHWVWSNGSGCFSPVTSPAEEQSVREALSEITCCGGVQWQSLLCVCVRVCETSGGKCIDKPITPWPPSRIHFQTRSLC